MWVRTFVGNIINLDRADRIFVQPPNVGPFVQPTWTVLAQYGNEAEVIVQAEERVHAERVHTRIWQALSNKTEVALDLSNIKLPVKIRTSG